MRGSEKPGFPCIERGKKVFEQFWKVDIEKAIQYFNSRFDEGAKNGFNSD